MEDYGVPLYPFIDRAVSQMKIQQLLNLLSEISEPVNVRLVADYLNQYFSSKDYRLNDTVPSGKFAGTTLVWWAIYVNRVDPKPLSLIKKKLKKLKSQIDPATASPDGRNLVWLAMSLLLHNNKNGLRFLEALKVPARSLNLTKTPDMPDYEGMDAVSLAYEASRRQNQRGLSFLRKIECTARDINFNTLVIRQGEKVPLLLAGLFQLNSRHPEIFDFITDLNPNLNNVDLIAHCTYQPSMRMLLFAKSHSATIYMLMLENIAQITNSMIVIAEDGYNEIEVSSFRLKRLTQILASHSLDEFVPEDNLVKFNRWYQNAMNTEHPSTRRILRKLLTACSLKYDVMGLTNNVILLIYIGYLRYLGSQPNTPWKYQLFEQLRPVIEQKLNSIINSQPEYYYYMADMFRVFGHHEMAKDYYKQVPSDDPYYSDAQIALASHYYSASDSPDLVKVMTYLLQGGSNTLLFRLRVVLKYCQITSGTPQEWLYQYPILGFSPPSNMSASQYLDVMQAQLSLYTQQEETERSVFPVDCHLITKVGPLNRLTKRH